MYFSEQGSTRCVRLVPRGVCRRQLCSACVLTLCFHYNVHILQLPWQPDSVRHAALQLRLALQHGTQRDPHLVDMLARFRAELVALCQSALDSSPVASMDDDTYGEHVSLVTYLARIGASVPLEVFQWSLVDDRTGASRSDQSGLFPLHLFCQMSPPSPTLSHYDHEPLFDLIAKAHPEATTIPCPRTGLLPLSMALQSGWSFRVLQSLVVVPQAIHRAFVDAASARDSLSSDIAVRARKRIVGDKGMWQ